MTDIDLAAVRAAVGQVCDPEYPDLTIADLGIYERVGMIDDRVIVELVPTVLGCPALGVIERDVAAAARSVEGVVDVDVVFLSRPPWSPARISPHAERFLAEEMTIAIRGADGAVICPVCGSRDVTERSAFGPTVCRSVSFCEDCRNPVEVVRT